MTTRVVLVHGFTQTRDCWGPVVDALASSDTDVVSLDAPGHGSASAVRADLAATADRLARVGPATFVGYSMGARMCLETALRHPEAVERLVLVSGTAGIEDPADRDARRAEDEARAEHIETAGVDAFVDEWLGLPLFAGLPAEYRYEAERKRNTVAGLASSLRLAGTGTQEPSWDRLPGLMMPVLVVAGSDDAKYAALAERMALTIGSNAALAVIDGAGHTVHLEAPDAFLAVLVPFVTSASD